MEVCVWDPGSKGLLEGIYGHKEYLSEIGRMDFGFNRFDSQDLGGYLREGDYLGINGDWDLTEEMGQIPHQVGYVYVNSSKEIRLDCCAIDLESGKVFTWSWMGPFGKVVSAPVIGKDCKINLRISSGKICRINQRFRVLMGLLSLAIYIWGKDAERVITSFTLLSCNSCKRSVSICGSGYRKTMTQASLVGKSGDEKNVAGTRKRLKISVPHFDNTELIKQYDRTLIGRCMNPAAQDVKALIVMLPKIRKVEDRVAGTDLGLGRFQFDFVEEEDIEMVLQAQPYHFDYWMLAFARWQPRMPTTFPSAIPFWIKVMGVPLEFWDAPTFQSIGDALGDTVEVDLDYGRVKVIVEGSKELCFETVVDFAGGEYHEGGEAQITLKYERLFGYCEHCYQLSHGADHCPLNPISPRKKRDVRELPLSRQEDRARSYKGVVIKGKDDGERYNRGHDLKEFEGKGKGKMHVEDEEQWVKVSEKRSYRHQPSRYDHKSSRGDRHRDYSTEERGRVYRGTRREEGVFLAREKKSTKPRDPVTRPQEEQSDSNIILAPRQKVSLNPEGVENGLDLVNEALGVEENIEIGENEMELDGEQDKDIENTGMVSEDDGFQDLSDAEMQETKSQEGLKDIGVEETQEGEMEGQEMVGGNGEKKKVIKKNLFKTASIAGISTKARMVQAAIATRKKANNKGSSRNGEGVKQKEEKGPSNPKPPAPKA